MLVWKNETINSYSYGVEYLTASAYLGKRKIIYFELKNHEKYSYVTIRSIWNSKELLFQENKDSDFIVNNKFVNNFIINGIEDVKKYCQIRFDKWLEETGLTYV